MVFPLIIKSAAGSGMMLYLWHLNPNLVLRGFVDAHNVEPNIMTEILDACQELKVNGENSRLVFCSSCFTVPSPPAKF
jgi:CCR4-NOT transcription complex subunit 1